MSRDAPRSEPPTLREWVWQRAWWVPGAALVALLLAHVFAAPGVASTCARILELSARAGEAAGPPEREACERRYAEIQAQVSALRWARMAWCIRRARSMPDVGGC